MVATSTTDIAQLNKEYSFASWIAQGGWNPIVMDRAEGAYFWTPDGQKYIDWSSQLVNVNVGHGHPHVIKAIQEQIAKQSFAYPGIATEVRGRLAQMISEVTPGNLKKSFFTNAGSEAVENAMKMARLYTGRQKILTRYRSYHGGTFGSATAGGDPRRLGNEPGVPWIVRLPDPYAYQSPVYRGRTQEEGDMIIADMIEEIVHFEGPENCAAVLWEGYSGSSGVIQPSEKFFNRLSEICQQYGILLIIDEVMSGFCRTGEWFGIDHYPDVKVDIMTMAKGLTSGYVPLGATVASEEIADYFDDHVFHGGLTYSSHPLGCAAGIANIEVYKNENILDNVREMGKVLRQGLQDLAEKHPVIGDIRGAGLHHVIELVTDREKRTPIGPYNKPFTEPMAIVNKHFREEGLSTLMKWSWIFCTPPLISTEEDIQYGLGIIDAALDKIDHFYTGKE